MKAIIAALLLTAAGAWSAAGCAAPPSGGQSAAGQASKAAPPVSDRQLKTFAAIRRDLNAVSTEYMARLKAANSNQERKQVRRNARQAMIDAIKKHGMTLDQFRDMAKTISQNERLKQELKAMEPGNG